MSAPLELAENALGSHLALQMLHRALKATFAHVHLDGLALNRFAYHSVFLCFFQEPRRLTQCTR